MFRCVAIEHFSRTTGVDRTGTGAAGAHDMLISTHVYQVFYPTPRHVLSAAAATSGEPFMRG